MTGEKEIVEVAKHRKRKVPKYVQKQLKIFGWNKIYR
jgi:hypothetical protein